MKHIYGTAELLVGILILILAFKSPEGISWWVLIVSLGLIGFGSKTVITGFIDYAQKKSKNDLGKRDR